MKPRKSLGQNFLVDQNYLDKIASHCVSQITDSLLEIGPGTCNLTRYILNKVPHAQVKAIEIDPRSEEYLTKLKEEHPNFDFMIADASKHDYTNLDLVVGNLPYNIGTNILLSCVRSGVKRMVFLLQAEVVDRVVAKPKSPDYGSLSVLVQAYYEVKSVLKIPPPAFNPAPSIYSKLLVCDIRTNPNPALAYGSFASLLRRAFQQPRKTLQNNLGKDLIQATKLDPMIRPGCLSVNDYIGLLPYFSLIVGHVRHCCVDLNQS